jgi:CheY-like chemotaxis protein
MTTNVQASGRLRTILTRHLGGQFASLILLIFLVCDPRASFAADQPSGKPATAGGAQYADFQTVLKHQMHFSAEEQARPAPAFSYQTILIGLMLTFVVVLAFRRAAPILAGMLNQQADDTIAMRVAAEIEAEQDSYANFVQEFKRGPEVTHAKGPEPSAATPTPVETLLGLAPERIETIRTLFARVSRAPDEGGRQATLGELCEQVRQFSVMCDSPQLQPVWQLTMALKGLLSQISQKPAHLTPSTLRTTAGAIVLLESLCKPGLDPKILTHPAAQFLAIDDDPISRHAVSASLKKSLSQPDLAENGAAGLALAVEKAYDVIFLDVEMPGMDGYEVCSKIHEQGANVKTPIVFVTSHSDFDSRAKSTEAGGHDLIAKPFLAFEITVKALTLVLRHRLKFPTAKECKPATALPDSVARGVESKCKTQDSKARAKVTSQAQPTPCAPVAPSPSTTSRTSSEFATTFLASAPTQLRDFAGQIEHLMTAGTPATQRDVLAALYLGISTLAEAAKRAQMECFFHLSSSLGNLFRKYIENPKQVTASGLATADAAVALLIELCEAGTGLKLSHSALNLLIVDDDPISRRAIAGALQVSFGKPDTADSGEAALAAALEKEYDAIFMDVQMPGMDGFTACSEIHQTALNGTTPVVFVTSHQGLDPQLRAGEVGGSGFITKPVVSAEIRLTALTFCLRGRLDRITKPRTMEEAVC